MMNYQTPSLEVVDLELVNVILASAGDESSSAEITLGPNQLPIVP